MLSENTIKFGIIGTGVVGTSLAILLEKAGLECIGVHTRGKRSYDHFRRYLPKEQLGLKQLVMESDLIFITTQDCNIEEEAARLSQESDIKPGQIWIHCSGSLPSGVMCQDPVLPVGYLSLHPLQAFANIDTAVSVMKGTYFGIEGSSPEVERQGEKLVMLLGGIPLKINPAKKSLYHAGAVVVSNYLVSLVLLAVKLFEQAGIERKDALAALLPLLAGSCRNIGKLGLPGALTGPIARGDAEVVARHLQSMPEEIRTVYRELGKLALELGLEKKLWDRASYRPEDLNELEELLNDLGKETKQ